MKRISIAIGSLVLLALLAMSGQSSTAHAGTQVYLGFGLGDGYPQPVHYRPPPPPPWYYERGYWHRVPPPPPPRWWHHRPPPPPPYYEYRHPRYRHDYWHRDRW